MSSVSNNYSRTQMLSDFSDGQIAVNDSLLQQVDNKMRQAGASSAEIATVKSELKSVAGSDQLIRGDEFKTLFQKLDGHDKNGSTNSFALTNGSGAKTLCGAVIDALKENKATVATYTRDDFNAEFKSGSVKVDNALLSKVSSALSKSPYNLSVSERNVICDNLKVIAGADGNISGAELQSLFKEIDRHDKNGSNDSFIVSTTVGNTTTSTASGAILGIVQNGYSENVGLTKDALMAAIGNGSIDITDISISDQISLTCLGISLLDMKGCCDKLLSLTISNDKAKGELFDLLDKLDGNKDQVITTDVNYIGKASEKTKAGKAWDILQKYVVKGETAKTEENPVANNPTVDEPATTTPSTPIVKVDQNAAHLTADNAVKVTSNWANDGLSAQDKTDIAANRKLITQRVNIKKTTSLKGGYVYYGNPSKDPTPTAIQEGKASKQVQWAYEELAGEGCATAVNTYDGQLFTFGRGFAGKSGNLTKVLTKWLSNEDVAAEFAKYGVGLQEIKNKKGEVTGYKVAVADPSTGTVKTGTDAYQYIHDHLEMQHIFVNIGEDPRFAQSCIDAQYDVMCNGTAKIPSYAQNFDENMIKFGSHMTHWLPGAMGWNSAVKYSTCTSDVEMVVKGFTGLGKFVEAGKLGGKYSSIAAGNNTYVINNNAYGGQQLYGVGKGSIWANVKKAAGASKAISKADINAGKYSGYILFEDPKAAGKYYVLSQGYKAAK